MGDTAIVDTLLAHGADVKAVDKKGGPAARGGGSRPQRDRRHVATRRKEVQGRPRCRAAQGHTATVDTLLAHGADAKAATIKGLARLIRRCSRLNSNEII